jgi:hypothetical protein
MKDHIRTSPGYTVMEQLESYAMHNIYLRSLAVHPINSSVILF